ncbi:MAG: helix-turn-helix transcriptional regulator, partial [Chloroflexota bacterium]
MPETLLRTKLFVPPLRPNLVSRAHLIDRLDQGLQLGHKLTLISAPAGFGKTTLVSEWIAGLRSDGLGERENRIAWLSLDENDNDPARFLSYIIESLSRADGSDAAFGKGALSMLQSPQPAPIQSVLSLLINELAGILGQTLLILDDVHVIDSPPIHDALDFLIEHLPPQTFLVIVTRDDPRLPLARLRARGQLTELRAADLRFSSSEAAEFLNQVMGLDLSEEDVAALEIRTE